MSDPLSLLARAIAAVAPHVNADTWAAALTAPMRAHGITTPRRIAMLLGQCAEESGGFEQLEEDLYYTTALQMTRVWPSHFPTLADASPFIDQPEALANRVYAARLGNGDEDSGDGWKFRGRGLIQLTGRTLYTDFALSTSSGDSEAQDVDEIADWLVTPAGAAASACWYWNWAYHGRLNGLADVWDVAGATRLINGGETNEAARLALCTAALAVFNTPSPAPTPPTPPAETAGEIEADRLDDLYNPAVPK